MLKNRRQFYACIRNAPHTLLWVDNIIGLPLCCQPVCVSVSVCVCVAQIHIGFICLKGAARSLQIRVSKALWRELIRGLEKGSDTTGVQIMHHHYASISVEKQWNRIWTLAWRAAPELGLCWRCFSYVPPSQRATLTDHASKGLTHATSSTSNIQKGQCSLQLRSPQCSREWGMLPGLG